MLLSSVIQKNTRKYCGDPNGLCDQQQQTAERYTIVWRCAFVVVVDCHHRSCCWRCCCRCFSGYHGGYLIVYCIMSNMSDSLSMRVICSINAGRSLSKANFADLSNAGISISVEWDFQPVRFCVENAIPSFWLCFVIHKPVSVFASKVAIYVLIIDHKNSSYTNARIVGTEEIGHISPSRVPEIGAKLQ